MPDLTTTYMGIPLANPLIVGSSTHTATADKVRQMADAGAGAVVMKSIFEEQIRMEMTPAYEDLAGHMHPEACEYLRADLPMQIGPEAYIKTLVEARKAVSIPLIASINCTTPDRWLTFASKIESAGADALELNIYDIPDSMDTPGEVIENRHLELIAAVTSAIAIPVAVKLGPFYSSLPHFARQVSDLNVGALVLFNRFFQPDIDIDTLALQNVVSLSRAEDLRLPLRWIALLRDQVRCSLCLTTGVHSAEGMIKALLAGADAVQVCSVLYRQNKDAIGIILDGLREWMELKGFSSLPEFRGMLRQAGLSQSPGFERAQYMRTMVGLE